MTEHRIHRPLRDRLQLAAFAMVLTVITIAVAMHAGGPETSPFTHLFGDDLVPSYMAGSFAREGRLDLLHDYDAARHFQQALRQQADLEQHGRTGPWLNPPFYVSVFVPLSALPYRAALWTWFALNVVMLTTALVLLYRMLPAEHRRPADGVILAALVAVSMPALQAMACQQNTFLSLLILCVSVSLARSGRAFAAGAVGALLLFKPQLAVLVCGAMVCLLGRRAFFGVVVTGASLLLATMIALPGALTDYLQKLPGLLPYLRTDRPFPWERQTTFLGFWRLLIGGRTGGPNPTSITLLWLAGAAVVGLTLALPVCHQWIARMRTGGCIGSFLPRDRFLAATIAAAPLLMPYYMDYDLLLLAVPAVLLAGERMRTGGLRGDRWLFAIWVAVYLWLYFNAAVAASTGISLIVVLLLVRFFAPVRAFWAAVEPRPCTQPIDTGGTDHGMPVTVAPSDAFSDSSGPSRNRISAAADLRSSIILGVVTAMAAAFVAALAGALDRKSPLAFGHDLIPSYVAGRLVVEGRAAELYNIASTQEVGRQIVLEQNLIKDQAHIFWINPPGFSLLFAPLSLLPYRVALLVWLAINAGLAAAALRVLLRWTAARQWAASRSGEALSPSPAAGAGRSSFYLGVAALTSCPFLLAVEHQQNTFISLALLVAAVAAWRRNRVMLAGLLVGLFACKPQLAFAIGLTLWICEGRRALAGMLVGGLAVLAAGEWIAPGSTNDFIRGVPSSVGVLQHHPGYNWGRQMTPTAFLRTLFGADSQPALMVGHVLSALVLLAVGWTAHRLRRPSAAGVQQTKTIDRRRLRAIAVAVLATPLCAPYFMDYDLLLLVVPFALLLNTRHAKLAIIGGVILWPLLYLNVDLVARTDINLVVVLLLALLSLLIRSVLREQQESGRRPHMIESAGPSAMPAIEPAYS